MCVLHFTLVLLNVWIGEDPAILFLLRSLCVSFNVIWLGMSGYYYPKPL